MGRITQMILFKLDELYSIFFLSSETKNQILILIVTTVNFLQGCCAAVCTFFKLKKIMLDYAYMSYRILQNLFSY